MIAIDTNIVVRVLTNDDPRQAANARSLIDNHEVFLPTTVLLETEWVLRRLFGKSTADILVALRAFLGLATVHAQDLAASVTALDWAKQGMEFADALHLASSVGCESFASFDRDMSKLAAKLGAPTVRSP